LRDERVSEAFVFRVEGCADGDHRWASCVDGVDDLGVVDALGVDGGDAEVVVTELALDDDQRDAFAGHLDRVGVAELVCGAKRRSTPAAAAVRRSLRAGGRGCPGSAACRSVDDAEQRADGKLNAEFEPRLEFLPAPVVHADWVCPMKCVWSW
jgi:hypothetical protein